MLDDRDLYGCEFYTEEDGKDTVEVIGKTHVSFAVISTVIALIQNFLNEQKPDAIGFTAEGASRIRLYRALMSKLSGRLPAGYVVRSDGKHRAAFHIYQDHSSKSS